MTARGLRNNNPGNIIQSATATFPGEISPSTDPKFKQFRNIEHGYAAVFLLLNRYINRGVNTIYKIMYRYDPPPDRTQVYIDHVTAASGKNENEIINPEDWKTLREIVAEISRVENGVEPNYLKIDAGMALARVQLAKEKIIKWTLIILLVMIFLALIVILYTQRKLLFD